MEPAGTLPRLAPTLPFKFVGGRVALDSPQHGRLARRWPRAGPTRQLRATAAVGRGGRRRLPGLIRATAEAGGGRAVGGGEEPGALPRAPPDAASLGGGARQRQGPGACARPSDTVRPRGPRASRARGGFARAPESAPDGRAWTTRSMALCGRWSGTRSSSSSRRNRRGSGSAADRTAAGSTSTGAGTGSAAGARWRPAERPPRTADGDDGRAGAVARARPGTSLGGDR